MYIYLNCHVSISKARQYAVLHEIKVKCQGTYLTLLTNCLYHVCVCVRARQCVRQCVSSVLNDHIILICLLLYFLHVNSMKQYEKGSCRIIEAL